MTSATPLGDRSHPEFATSRSIPSWESVAFVYLVAGLMGVVGVVLPACGPFLRGKGLTQGAYGWLFVGLLGAGVFAATWRTTLGRDCRLPAIFAGGITISAAAMGLVAWSGGISGTMFVPLLLAAGVIQGIGGSLTGMSGNHATVALFPARRGTALGIFHAVGGVGAASAPLLVAWLGEGAWRLAPLGVMCVLLSAASWGWFRGNQMFPFPTVRAELTHHARHSFAPSGRWLAMGFLCGLSEATVMYWSVLCLVRHARLLPATADHVLAVFWLAMTGMRFCGSLVYRGKFRIWALRAHLLLFAGSFWLIAGASDETSAILALALAGISASIVYPQVMGRATESWSGPIGQMVACMTLVTCVGQAFGAWLTGFLGDYWDLDNAFRIASVWGVLSFCLTYRR